MPRNIEIKARIKDLDEFKKRAQSISDQPERILMQHDTFFNTEKGRMKLRVEPDYTGLVYYDRPDQEGPKLSEFSQYQTNDPEALKCLLTQAFGVRGIIEKKRTLFMSGQTRIHVDEVKNLGSFMELEVVLRDDQSVDDGQSIATELMQKLNVNNNDLLTCAYMDLLENKE